MVDQADLQKRRAALIEHQAQLREELLIAEGKIRECDFWLAVLAKRAATEATDASVGEPSGS